MAESVAVASLPTGWRGTVIRGALAGLRATLTVSPRPTVWVIRRYFARSGRQLADSLRAGAPAGVAAILDEPYDGTPDTRLDVFCPDTAGSDGSRLPTVVWTHVGGSKDEIRDYLRRIAAAGFTVVGVNYTLAPAGTYPTPARQVMAALRHVEANADRLHADPTRLVLAGDSAGAHITAQVATVATDAGYAQRLGVEPAISANQLRGVALCCGIFDLDLMSPDSPLRAFVRAMAWAYSGTRDYQRNHFFTSTMPATRAVTSAFPPAFITAGNADPLLAHSRALASALESKGVTVETLFYPSDHQPALGHEYQFDLSLGDGRAAVQRLIAFFGRCTDSDGSGAETDSSAEKHG